MAALSTATPRRFRSIQSWTLNSRVANSDTIYIGSFCGWPGTNALTSRRGYLTTFRNQVNMIWGGICIGAGTAGDLSTTNTVVGSTSASPVVEATVEAGPLILEQYTVTGVSAQTDVMRTAVYASTDNDLTTTAGYPNAVGRVLYWYSSTTCDVLIYGTLNFLVI